MSTVATTDGILGERGMRAGVEWTTSAAARARAAQLVAEYRGNQQEIVRNPHLSAKWAREAVRAPLLLDSVRALIGPDVAVENTFLVVKWPMRFFQVPWHQDGIDARLDLDPGRSVSAWLAITDATELNGCLQVIPGSQRSGYLPFGPEAETGAERGRADQASGFTANNLTSVPLRAGTAVLMDSRLLHRSGSNGSTGTRVGLNVRYVAPDGVRRRDPQSPSLDPLCGSGW